MKLAARPKLEPGTVEKEMCCFELLAAFDEFIMSSCICIASFSFAIIEHHHDKFDYECKVRFWPDGLEALLPGLGEGLDESYCCHIHCVGGFRAGSR